MLAPCESADGARFKAPRGAPGASKHSELLPEVQRPLVAAAPPKCVLVSPNSSSLREQTLETANVEAHLSSAFYCHHHRYPGRCPGLARLYACRPGHGPAKALPSGPHKIGQSNTCARAGKRQQGG